jgi:molybdopterin/thiamine biosynthesis adenylyltransferase
VILYEIMASELTQEEYQYYSRQIVLKEFGLKGQLKLKSSRVLVAGLGGLGSQLSAQLASMGVGYLRLVDKDIVEASNLQRQHLYSVEVIGYPKVEAAAMRLGKMNPYIELDPVPMSINELTVDRLLEDVDLVVDGLDRMAPRYALNRACIRKGIPFIYGAAITHIGSVTTIIPGKTACLECFQGGVDDENVPSCATIGVTPSIISIVASIQVNEVMKLLLGVEPVLAGRLLYCDLTDLSFEKVKLSRAEFCKVCGDDKYMVLPPMDEIEEICGREGRRVFTVTPRNPVTVSINEAARLAEMRGFRLLVRGKLGVSFTKGSIRGSIFTTGVGVIEGAGSREEALDIYRSVFG